MMSSYKSSEISAPQYRQWYPVGPSRRRRRQQSGRSRIVFLASIPVIDPILGQINNAYQLTIGSFSILQVVRGALLGVLAVTVLMTQRGKSKSRQSPARIILAIGGCISILVMHEIFAENGLLEESLIAYTQILYWLAMWYVAGEWVQDERAGRTMIAGLVIGSVVTAASVYYGYAIGVTNTTYTDVRSSAGWFGGGKGIAGSMLAGAWLAAYLGSKRRLWLFILIALFCLGGSFLTYARAGMVALCAAVIWLFYWSVSHGLSVGGKWARRLITAIICGIVVVAVTIGTTDLERRWSDLSDPDNAGSGRLYLWKTAVSSFVDGSPVQQLLGRGYHGMLEMMYGALGVRLHAHNDVMDMLVIGGVLGVLVLALLLGGVIRQIRSVQAGSSEAAVAIAILLVLCCQAFFTGQFFIPDIMTCYLFGITAVLACGPLKTAASARKVELAGAAERVRLQRLIQY